MEMRFADSVWYRVVQIVQEAMLMGVDCGDLLRQVRVVVDPEDPNSLVLSAEYQRQVKEMHEKLLSQARDIQAAQTGNKYILRDGSGGNN